MTKYWMFLHHKCASQYLRAQLSAAGQHAKRLTMIPALNSMGKPPNQEQLTYGMSQSDYCMDDNAWPETINMLDADVVNFRDWRAVHFVRDPRDLLVSAYFSHKHSHPTHSLPRLRAHREVLCSMPIETGMLAEMDFYVTENAIKSILTWPKHPNCKTFNAISLASDMARGELSMFKSVCAWINIPLEPDFTPPPSWDKVSDGRAAGDELNTHHYRHGVNGDWKRYFTRALEEEFTRHFGEVPE